MVLELRAQDRVARSDVREAPRIADEVDRLGRVARPDDLGGFRGIDEAGDLFAGRFKGCGRTFGQLVDAAMDVRIVVRVVVDERIDHGLRFLRARGRIEIGEPLSARRGLRKDRKIPGDFGSAEIEFGEHAENLDGPRAQFVSERGTKFGAQRVRGKT